MMIQDNCSVYNLQSHIFSEIIVNLGFSPLKRVSINVYAYFHHKLTHIFSYIIIMNLIQKHSEPEDDVCLVRNDYNIAFA